MRSSFLSSLQQTPPARLVLAHFEIRGVSMPFSAFSIGQMGDFDWISDVPTFVGSGTEAGWPVALSEDIVIVMERRGVRLLYKRELPFQANLLSQ